MTPGQNIIRVKILSDTGANKKTLHLKISKKGHNGHYGLSWISSDVLFSYLTHNHKVQPIQDTEGRRAK